MSIKFNNIHLMLSVVFSFGILFFVNDVSISKAISISATNYPQYPYDQIRIDGKPDLRIYSITKNVGLKNDNTGIELPYSTSSSNTFYTSDGGLYLSVIDQSSNINCRNTKEEDCGLRIYGVGDGEAQDDIKRTVSSSNSNIVTCDRSGCRLTGNEGSATITISFVDEGAFVYYSPRTKDRNDAESRKLFKFSMPNLYYNITVVKPNTPPTVTRCTLTATGYNTATASWTYTDVERDSQKGYRIYNIIPNSNLSWQTADIQTMNNSNSANITGLVAGGTYDKVNIQVYDGRNWSQPVICNSITTNPYPEPNVTYTLSKSVDPSTAKSNGQTLTVQTVDSVNANWEIRNGTGIGLQSCELSTIGFPELSGIGLPKGSVNNKTVPRQSKDVIYNVDLNCIGKRGYPVRNVNQTIRLEVQSYPAVSCSIQGGKKSVKLGNSSVNIEATVGNISSYTWKVGPNSSDKDRISKQGKNPIPKFINLDYNGIEFGRYRPWIEIISDTGRRVSANCPTITNFGDSQVKEVNP